MVVLDKWQENTSKYGGLKQDRPSQGQQEQVSLTETQASLTEPKVSLSGPKEDLIKKTNKEEDMSTKKISNDQTPLAMALASIRMEFTNGNMYSKPGPIFDQVYKPLKAAGLLQSGRTTTMNLTHPEPSVFDKQTEAMLRQAFVSIFGGEVEIKIMEETND